MARQFRSTYAALSCLTRPALQVWPSLKVSVSASSWNRTSLQTPTRGDSCACWRIGHQCFRALSLLSRSSKSLGRYESLSSTRPRTGATCYARFKQTLGAKAERHDDPYAEAKGPIEDREGMTATSGEGQARGAWHLWPKRFRPANRYPIMRRTARSANGAKTRVFEMLTVPSSLARASAAPKRPPRAANFPNQSINQASRRITSATENVLFDIVEEPYPLIERYGRRRPVRFRN